MISVLWLEPPEWPIVLLKRPTVLVFVSPMMYLPWVTVTVFTEQFWSKCKIEMILKIISDNYEASIHLENSNMNWLQFPHNQEKDGVYATELFIKATAVFLGIDIRVTSERCTLSNPFNVWSRFLDHHDGANNCFNGNVCMLLGNIDNVHFQSLIYNYEKNSHVDFTVETKTYASVLKNGSTLSDSDDISNINKSHLKRNIVMPENA